MAETRHVFIVNNPTCWALLWHDADPEAYDEIRDLTGDLLAGLDYGAWMVGLTRDDDELSITERRAITADEWSRLREGKAPWDD